MGALESALLVQRDAGRKLLVPYVTGGLGRDWLDVIEAVARAGADAIEVGIPFSDPVMDGPVIQEASRQALEQGATPEGLLHALSDRRFDVPLAAMTYCNLMFHATPGGFADQLTSAGVSGTILPDLPLEEAGEWIEVAAKHEIDHVLLAAPTTPDERLRGICDASRGFVYGVGIMGVTGERETLAESASLIARRLKALTTKPVLVGIGVSTPEQAREAARSCDGVIVGSALVRRLLDGEGPAGAAAFVASLRKALDEPTSVQQIR